MAAFGWSVGDLVSAISVVAKVSKALKDVGGAGDDYRETVLFLESLNVTLNTLSGLYEAKVDPNILLGVQSQLKLVQKPVDIFTEKVKRKLGSALDGTQKATGFRARIKRASSKLEWAFWLNEQSQTLNKKILVPLIEIQIQLGIQIHSVISTVAHDITTKVEKKIDNALLELIQQHLTPIKALKYRHHADGHDVNEVINQKIESLPQIVADNVELSLNKSRQIDDLRSQKLEDYYSLLFKAIDKVEEKLQENNVEDSPRISTGINALSHELQIYSSPSILKETSFRARSRPSEVQRNERNSAELTESRFKFMVETGSNISDSNVVSLHKNKPQDIKSASVASRQAWVEATIHFKQFIVLLVQAFREFFLELWPMFALFLNQAKIMQRYISQLPSLLSKENITFVDALGRSRRIPYMTYGHWKTFNKFVFADFQKIPGEGHVQRSRYELIASDGTTTLNESNWKTFVLPNVEISMVVKLNLSVREISCPKCKSPSKRSTCNLSGLTTCGNPDCQLKYRLIPHKPRLAKPQAMIGNSYLNTSSEVCAWLEVASSLKRVEYANMREKANALALTDATKNLQFQSNGLEPYRHLLGVKRMEDKESPYMGNEIRAHTGALKVRKQETTELHLYFKNVQCHIFPLECEICGFSDFQYPDEVPRHMLQAHTCIYTCLFDFAGCQHAFAREDQWKCHVKCEHLNWLCDVDQCPNESLHPVNHYKKGWYAKTKPRHALALQTRANRANAILNASLRERKNLPSKLGCPVKGCKRDFDGETCWSDRMGHVGEHIVDTAIGVDGYLCSKRFLDNTTDETFIGWALDERIVQMVGRKFRLVVPE